MLAHVEAARNINNVVVESRDSMDSIHAEQVELSNLKSETEKMGVSL